MCFSVVSSLVAKQLSLHHFMHECIQYHFIIHLCNNLLEIEECMVICV